MPDVKPKGGVDLRVLHYEGIERSCSLFSSSSTRVKLCRNSCRMLNGVGGLKLHLYIPRDSRRARGEARA